MDKIQEIVNKMVEVVKAYPVGTEFTMVKLIESVDESCDFSDFLYAGTIVQKFHYKCKEEKISIETMHPGECIGLPWAGKYIKK